MSRTLALVVIVMMVLSGCVTSSPNSSNVNMLQMRVGELEREVQTKDNEIKDLQYQIKDLSYEIDRLKNKSPRMEKRPAVSSAVPASSKTEADDDIIRVKASIRQVQVALKKAGYYKGNIDGKVGDMTKTAISDFQKDHGLKVDGILGQKTWNELKTYLE